MNSVARVPLHRTIGPAIAIALSLAAGLVLRTAPAQAQPSNGVKKELTIDDYSKWRSIGGSQISGDGKWVSYTLQFTNTNEPRPVLHLLRLDDNQSQEIANGGGAVFSDDSKWVAYAITPPTSGRGGGGRGGGGGAGVGGGAGGPPPAQQGGRGGRGGPAQTRRVELRNLATGAMKSWEDIVSFSFAPGSGHLQLRRRQTTPNATHAGVDVILHDLANGRDQLLGSVNELAFNDKGNLMAYTIDAAVRDGNGLFIMDLAADRVHPLDNDSRIYSQLAWNEDGTSLAVLKGVEVSGKRERDNILIAFPNVQAAISAPSPTAPATLNPATANGFPREWVVSERRGLTWSSDGKYVYLGIKAQVPVPDTAARNRGTNEVSNVDVWNWKDQRIQSQQMGTANADMNFTFRASFDVTANRFIRLTDSAMRDVDTPRSGRWGVGRDERAYIHDYERPATDFYRVNLATGERTLMLRKQLSFGGNVFGSSPDGKFFLYWKDGHINAFDLDAMTSKPLTKSVPVSFVDMEYDNPGPRPAYGITGFTADGKSVIVNHRYDLWLVPLDGTSAPKNLTNGVGTRGDIRFNYVRTDAAAAGGGGRGGRGGGGGAPIDLSKPALLAAYGQWTKKTGYYELSPSGEMKELVYIDAAIGGLQKAAKADKYMFTRSTFAEFPDLQVSGPTFADARKITNANPQQAEYKWGKRILFDYKNKKGVRLQGILAIPDDYQPGEKRPMIINFYEKNSQNLHRHQPPSYLSSFNQMPTEALTKGYLLMLPDIHFNTRTSHSDMLECIEAATKKVIEMGYADPKRIGLHGHSYSGQGAALVGTKSRMFAAVGMGAGVSDMTSDFSHNWGWSYQIGGTGANAFDYYLYTQGRQGTNPWDDPVLYREESGRTHVREAVAPFLIMHGTADPTVAFQEGLGMYNAMRFNNKPAVLLAYPGEGHGLNGLANRRDFTIRYMQFFDHFLRGMPAPKWWTEGVAYLDKDGTKDPRE